MATSQAWHTGKSRNHRYAPAACRSPLFEVWLLWGETSPLRLDAIEAAIGIEEVLC